MKKNHKKKFKTIKEKHQIIVNPKINNYKKHLSVNEQLKKLESMNFTIDVDRNLAKSYLSRESYVQFFKSYEDVFIEHVTNNNFPKFKINKFSKPKSIIKHLKNVNFKYSKSNKFSELIKFKTMDLDLREYLLKLTYDIELIVKTKLVEFIGEALNGESWGVWLLKITSKDFYEESVNLLYEYQIYEDSVQQSIQELSLGKLTKILEIIFNSDIVKNRRIKKLCKSLFVDSLNKYVDIYKPDYEFLIWKLSVLNRVRNYIAHTERFGRFLLKERLAHLKQYAKKSYVEFRFVKNTNEDLSIGYFMGNNKYKILNKKLVDLSHLLKNFKLGYFVEIHNSVNNTVECLELKILEDLIWWFNWK